MKDFVVSTALEKDLMRSKLRRKDLSRFKEVVRLLMFGRPIPRVFKDHALSGKWKNYRELHLEPDYLFIYRVTDTTIFGQRLGTHADLFE